MFTKQRYAVAFLASTLVLFAAAHQSWPEIKPINRTFYFTDVDRASVDFYLRNPQGKPLYWFGCHSADFTGKPIDPYHDDESDYYGMFDCHLHLLKDKDGYNLLSYSATDHRENFSRAFISPEELQGRCADYPEWGCIRHIRLRGMRITLEFGEVRLGQDFITTQRPKPKGKIVQSFRLDLRIEPDKGALSAIAEPPGFANPHRVLPGSTNNISDDCAKVIPEHVTH
jgi:hypothetical protein